MKVAIAKFILFKIMKWKIVGDFPDSISKFVIIGAPHTSNYDFIIGLLVKTIKGVNANFIAKSSLFIFPLNYFFKSVGGIPVKRNSKTNMVDTIVQVFNNHKKFVIAVSPEGTRNKVDRWKTGFYFIAKQANVPIVGLTFDFGKRQTQIFSPFYTTDNQEADFRFLKSYYKGIKGKFAENS